MTFSVLVLGSNSAIPTLTRNPSAHLLNASERLFLIDCAEGTQLQLRRYHVHFQRIRHIFISHLHGDHFYGLIGLLTSFHLLGRKEELHLYGPLELWHILRIQLDASQTRLIYPVMFHELTGDGRTGDQKTSRGKQDPGSNGRKQIPGTNLLYEDDLLTIHSFPLLHSIPTWGFLFREKLQPRKIRKEILNRLTIPNEWMNRIKNGEDYVDEEGKNYANRELTLDPPKPRSYAYCTDTAYTETIVPVIRSVDLLYHEATFMNDMAEAAREKYHSTAAEAAAIAKSAGVKKLIIGHFSARYDDLGPLLEEARVVFPETELADDGRVFSV
jgi:ribonuclease Z